MTGKDPHSGVESIGESLTTVNCRASKNWASVSRTYAALAIANCRLSTGWQISAGEARAKRGICRAVDLQSSIISNVEHADEGQDVYPHAHGSWLTICRPQLEACGANANMAGAVNAGFERMRRPLKNYS